MNKMAKSKPLKSARISKTSGSLFGTRWVANGDSFCARWPTIPGASAVGCCGLAFSLGVWPFLIGLDVKFGDPYAWWQWTLFANFLCILLIVFSQLCNESFSISRRQVERTRWPAFLRPRQVIETARIIKVIIELKSRHVFDEDGFDHGVEQVGTLKVKALGSDGVESWKVGCGLSSSDAMSIGEHLSKFVEVGVKDNRA